MVTIDYDLIRKWLKENHITLRKLSEDTGIPEGTLYSSFNRGSKMQVAYVWRIADYMNVQPSDLLRPDENGMKDFDDLDRINFGRTDYEVEIENTTISERIIPLLKCLNPGGLEQAGMLIGLLWEIPRFRKNVNEYYDGTPDYWKRHPYQKEVKPFDKEKEENENGKS